MSLLQASRSTVEKAYDIIMERYPETIEPGEKTFHLGDACNMRNLNEVHDEVEDWLENADFPEPVDQIISSLEWSIYQTIHSALKNLKSLNKADIDFEAVLSRFDSHPNFKVISDAQNQ
jgi:uncharacterized protein YciU (UPF0263 family)